ncbi:MAG: polysaccharide deacetylase family protein [Sarcina sp.]
MNSKGRLTAIAIIAVLAVGGAGIITYNKMHENKKTVVATEKVNQVHKEPNPTDIIPNDNIIYAAKNYAVPANDVATMLAGKSTNKTKEIFLTFDDGPSKYTPEVLKILKEKGVHATFFVLGSQLAESNEHKDYLKQEILDGNAIANHTYSHNFKTLYPHNSVDVSTFMGEINKTNDIMKSILGNNFNARVLRMPGGYMSRAYYHDKNLPELNSELDKMHITSIDWDAETGDATGKRYTPQQLVNNAIKETKDETHIILLMHDSATKKTTVEALPELIDYYKSQGYEFKVIENPTVESFNSKETASNNIDKNKTVNTQTTNTTQK